MGEPLDRICRKKYDSHKRRKGVKTKSKGYKLDGIVLMMKKKDIKQ